jgi:hypothetical protein
LSIGGHLTPSNEGRDDSQGGTDETKDGGFFSITDGDTKCHGKHDGRSHKA